MEKGRVSILSIITITLMVMLLLNLVSCEVNNSNDDYDKGVKAGYEQGYNMGEYVGFREGCELGYKQGRYEASIGLEPSMDWFFTHYPQYR